MADYQRVVEFLRDIRLTPPPPVTDELRQYAAEYAEMCVQANDRLRKCTGFLQQGLRTEAIHLADESPNLLDLVAALDLPEATLWVEFCQTNGLPVAPQLQMDRANQINDAYAADQPVEHMLQQHRLLALARAPVKDRLAVMRAIATADPGLAAANFWEKDLRVFERARIRELPTSFYAAVRNRDFGTIAELAREIEQSPWLEPIPADLREAVADAYARMSRAQVEEHLRTMVPALRDAFAARSLPECTELLRKWREALKSAGIDKLSADLAAEAEPVAAWVQQENELQARQKSFVAACQQFAAALDGHAPLSELEPAMEKLKRFDSPIPEDLERRYHQRIQDRVVAARRRFAMVLTGLAATVAAVLAVVALVAYIYFRTWSAESWAGSIETANASRNLPRATQLIKDQETRAPHLNTNPRVAAAKTATHVLQDDFERDTATLKDLIARLADAQSKATPLTTAPSPAIDDLLAEAGKLDDVLARAGAHDLTWVDTSGQLASATKAAADLRAQFRHKAAGLVTAQIETLGKQLDAVPTNPTGTELTDALANVNALTNKATALRDLPGLEETTKADVTKLLSRLEQRRDAMDQAKGQLGDLQAIAQKSSSADELKKAMEEFVAKFPNAAATTDFSKALEAMPVAKSVEAWKKLLTDWGLSGVGTTRFAPSAATEATKRAEGVEAYLEAYRSSPLRSAATAYHDYLKRAAEAMADKSTWQTGFNEITASPLYAELSYMEDASGARYYVLGDIKRTERKLNNLITVDFQAIDAKELAKRRTITITPPNKLVTDKPVKLPHAKFVTEMADKIKFLSDADWDTYGFDLIDKLVSTDMDMVVKAILLQKAMETTKAVAGWAIGDLYEKPLQELTRQQVTEMAWYDVEHPVSPGTLEALKKIVQSVPKKQAALELYNARKAAMFKTLGFDYSGKGVLLKNDKGAWAVFTRDSSADGYRAWAVGAPGADGAGKLTPVATYKDGKYVVDEIAAADVPQGTMVFTGKP